MNDESQGYTMRINLKDGSHTLTPDEPSVPASGSGRSSAFFESDVCESVDYVLDQAGMYRDQAAFANAVAARLKKWASTAQNTKL